MKKLVDKMNSFAINITKPLSEEVYTLFLDTLDEDMQQKILRYKRKSDRDLKLSTHVLLRVMLHKLYRMNLEEMYYKTNQFGKPFLPGSSIHFNLSHSGSWGACVIDQTPIGVDIEEILPIDINGMSTFFSRKEQLLLLQTPEKEKIELFYRLWTLKESYVKKLGLGLSKSIDSFTFHMSSGVIKVEDNYQPLYDQPHFFYEEQIEKLYKLTICAQHGNFPKETTVISVNYLYQYLVNLK